MFNEIPDDVFQGNAYTERGHELEPDALELFQLETMREVRPGAFGKLEIRVVALMAYAMKLRLK